MNLHDKIVEIIKEVLTIIDTVSADESIDTSTVNVDELADHVIESNLKATGESRMSISIPCHQCKNKFYRFHSVSSESNNPCEYCGFNIDYILKTSNYQKEDN